MTETVEEQMISVSVNGERRTVPSGRTIAEMLETLGIAPEKVAVERNREIVSRSTLGQVRVNDGDEFEIVHFVGGG
jgi:thiamine biosynthesis protein ThiS